MSCNINRLAPVYRDGLTAFPNIQANVDKESEMLPVQRKRIKNLVNDDKCLNAYINLKLSLHYSKRVFIYLASALMFLFVVFFDSAFAQEESICARVRIQLSQDVVIARNVFKATLEITNSPDNSPLENLLVVLDISDGDDFSANDLFGVHPPELSGVTDVNGTGVILSGASAVASWLIVPTRDAAPDEPVVYYVGGEFSYTQDGSTVTVPLFPTPILVKPDPLLVLDYFWVKDVYGDDPFTSGIEPSEPFPLGLMVRNNGNGVADNFRIISSQPQIIENEKGLLVDFKIIGSHVNSDPVSPSLSVNLGDIDPDTTSVATWMMTSSLQGQFIDYSATFVHIDGLGNPRLSLIDTVNIHELVHVVRVESPIDDNKPDFLTKESEGYRVYDSDNVDLDVTDQSDSSILTFVSSDGSEETYTLGMIPSIDFIYVKLPDPFNGQKMVKGILRSDGKIIRPENAWFSKTRVDNDPWQYFFNLFDINTTGDYTVIFEDICPAGYSGTNCEINIDECASVPCQNGGVCTDGVNSYTCTCPSGYTGLNCETNIDDCASTPCQNGGVCTDGINSYTCTCPTGFNGTSCETNVDDCASAPCQNGGVCTDGENSYTCACPAGYTGTNCEINIDDCASTPCQNGGVCTDGINSYTCICMEGYGGGNCELTEDCNGVPGGPAYLDDCGICDNDPSNDNITCADCYGNPNGGIGDADSDGVCDDVDQCPGEDDNKDTRGTGKPDCLNTAPIANAGYDQGDKLPGDDIILNGSDSTDNEGDILTYSWEVWSAPEGSSAALNNSNSIIPSITLDEYGTYVIRLVVDDGLAQSADFMQITMGNVKPVAIIADLGDGCFDGNNSYDPNNDTIVAFDWSVTSPDGTLTQISGLQICPLFPLPGGYTIVLVVSDEQTVSDPATLKVDIVNHQPVADAGLDQTDQIIGTEVCVDGVGSYDPDNFPNQTLLYDWAIIGLPFGSNPLLNPESESAVCFTPDYSGNYVLQLIVNDGELNSVPDTVMVSAIEGSESGPGDLNDDGVVDRLDVNVINLYRNQPASICSQCDIDGDGIITILDARMLIILCTYPLCASQ